MSIPTVTPVLTVGGTFAVGDYVGTSGAAMEFTRCGPSRSANGGGASGYIVGAALIDASAQTIPLELWLYDAPITPPNDNAAWSLSDANAKSCLGVISFNTYRVSALNSMSQGTLDGGALRFFTGDTTTSIFGCLVTRGAPVYTNGDLTVRLSIAIAS